jgi:hypothetical protein
VTAQAIGAASAAEALELEFVTPEGRRVEGPLMSTWHVRFEDCSPVRSVRTFKGQRNFDGLWWLATTGRHVGFESWLEREHLMLLDLDPDVVGVSSQPFWLRWRSDGRARKHAPDFFARCADGSGLVVDVRPDERISARDAEAFSITARVCARVGWRYRRVGGVDPVLAANARWLAGYRHPRCLRPAHAEALLGAFTVARSFAEGVALVGDPIAVNPVAFHLLWTGQLLTDLRQRLSGDSVISTRQLVP